MRSKIEYHVPSDEGDICLYDHETWPCTVVQVKRQAIAKVTDCLETMPTQSDGMILDVDTLATVITMIKEL